MKPYFMRVLMAALGALALLFLARRHVEASVRAAQAGRIRLTLIGVGILLVTPLVGVVLMVTVLGFLPGIALIALWAFLLLISLMFGPILVGVLLSELFQKSSQIVWSWTILGAFALATIRLIPFFGSLIGFFVLAWALGSASTYMWQLVQGTHTKSTDDSTTDGEETALASGDT
jgi:hypothetical protein